MNIYFAHGKESGPWGAKIQALAEVARSKGFRVESPDYSKQPDPDARVEQLLNLKLPSSELTVLVGSSMGGYVATVASHLMNPVGLFLMAPAFYLPGYKVQAPVPHAKKTVIVHGLQDDVVPVDNSIRFAREHGTELYLIDGDHRLNDQLPKIEVLFGLFLDDVLDLSGVAKTVTWEKIAESYGQHPCWSEPIWRKMVAAGYADYTNELERRYVLLRFIALTDFYSEFLSAFSRDCCEGEPQDTAKLLNLPIAVLDNLLDDYVVRRGHETAEAPTIQMALEEMARYYIYPILLDYYGSIENVADSIYRASYPTFFDEDANEYLTDPEDLDTAEKAQLIALEKIKSWLACKFDITGVVEGTAAALAGQ
ncbi:MAG: hypothetical protein IPQ16_14790 [Geobacteraceae bacterium]|nr:hypothetical protein [Geobacteraceae bacterium]